MQVLSEAIGCWMPWYFRLGQFKLSDVGAGKQTWFLQEREVSALTAEPVLQPPTFSF